MKKINRIFVTLFVLALAVAIAMPICSHTGGDKKHVSLKIVNWNVQTFFDANNDGIEYSNFQKSKKWGTEAYTERLKRLCDTIKTLDGDVVILEEIENEGIIYDISNQLAGENWTPKKVYRYGCFSKKKNSSIGCAVLSRYELCGLKVHSLDVKTESKKAPSMRPLMEVDLLVPKRQFGGGDVSRCLKIFVNHWKSKSGGEEESRIWRRWQEGLLAEKISQSENGGGGSAIICAGDFNQDINEFKVIMQDDFFQTAKIENAENENCDFSNIPNVEFGALDCDKKVSVYSPWIDFAGGDGSYYFRENWERIDHFFACGEIALTEFAPQNSGAWAYEDGRPKPFQLFSLNGYSDHLPIVCTVTF